MSIPVAAVTVGRKGEHIAPLAELAAAGAVAFSDDGDPVHDAEIMRRALEYARMFGKPIIQHAQEPTLTKGGAMNEGFTATELGLAGMPPIAEEIMIARDLRIVGYTGGQIPCRPPEHGRQCCARPAGKGGGAKGHV